MKSDYEIQRFFTPSEEWIEETDFYKNKYENLDEIYKRMSKHTRIIGFFHDKKEYLNEFKLFKKAASNLVGRDDLRIGVVIDTDLVKK